MFYYTQVTILNLQRNLIKEIDLSPLKDSKITELALWENQIKYINLRQLIDSQVTVLHLECEYIDLSPLEYLQLKELRFYKIPIVNNGFHKFSKHVNKNNQEISIMYQIQ